MKITLPKFCLQKVLSAYLLSTLTSIYEEKVMKSQANLFDICYILYVVFFDI